MGKFYFYLKIKGVDADGFIYLVYCVLIACISIKKVELKEFFMKKGGNFLLISAIKRVFAFENKGKGESLRCLPYKSFKEFYLSRDRGTKTALIMKGSLVG